MAPSGIVISWLSMKTTFCRIVFVGIAIVATHFSMPAVLGLAIVDGALAITAKALSRSAAATCLGQRNLLREGNAIMNLGMMSSTACAPVISGALVAWQGARSALFVDAGTFVVTAMVMASARDLRIETDLAASFRERIRKGASTVSSREPVRRLMIAISLVVLLGAVPIPIEVVFAKHTLHTGDLGYGLLLGAWGAGMVAGATTFAVASSFSLTGLFYGGVLAVAVGFAALALAPTLAVACIASVVGGAGNGAGWTAAVTAVQERIPLDSQSAVMTIFEGLNQVMPAIGFAVGGALTAASSPRLAYAFAAGGVVLIVGITATRPVGQVRLGDVASPEPGMRPAQSEAVAQDSSGSKRKPHLPNVTTG